MGVLWPTIGVISTRRESATLRVCAGPFDGMIAVMWALSHLPPRTLQALRNVKRRAFA